MRRIPITIGLVLLMVILVLLVKFFGPKDYIRNFTVMVSILLVFGLAIFIFLGGRNLLRIDPLPQTAPGLYVGLFILAIIIWIILRLLSNMVNR